MAIKSKRPGKLSKKVAYLHDNGDPHTAKITQCLLKQVKWDFQIPTILNRSGDVQLPPFSLVKKFIKEVDTSLLALNCKLQR